MVGDIRSTDPNADNGKQFANQMIQEFMNLPHSERIVIMTYSSQEKFY